MKTVIFYIGLSIIDGTDSIVTFSLIKKGRIVVIKTKT